MFLGLYQLSNRIWKSAFLTSWCLNSCGFCVFASGMQNELEYDDISLCLYHMWLRHLKQKQKFKNICTQFYVSNHLKPMIVGIDKIWDNMTPQQCLWPVSPIDLVLYLQVVIWSRKTWPTLVLANQSSGRWTQHCSLQPQCPGSVLSNLWHGQLTFLSTCLRI